MTRSRILPVTALALIAGRASSAGAVLFVDQDAQPGGDGSSWSLAFRDLADALEVVPADAGAQVWIAEGSYRPDRGTAARYLSFELVSGVALLGGFAGGESSPLERDPIAHPTILTGDLLGDDAPGFAPATIDDNSHHVCTALLLTMPTTLDGLVIRGGNATGPAFHSRGGALAAIAADIVLADCRLEANRAVHGGALHLLDGGASVVDTIVTGNVATQTGGAFDLQDTDLSLVDSSIVGNSASSAGGGAWIKGGSLTALGGTISLNSTSGNGGAIHAEGGDAALLFVELVGNHAGTGAIGPAGGAIDCIGPGAGPFAAVGCLFEANIGGVGGAIHIDIDAPLTVTQCTFRANLAAASGAASLSSDSATVVVDACVFVENGATGDFGVGALRASASAGVLIKDSLFHDNFSQAKCSAVRPSGESEVVGCTFYGNVGDDSGALEVNGSDACLVRGCTFLFNEADDAGGAVWAGASLAMEDCYFEGNYADSGGAASIAADVVTLRGCTFVANGAHGRGAAIWFTDGSPQVANCRFLGNVSKTSGGTGGGAVDSYHSSPTFANCIFAGNFSGHRGAGVYAWDGGTATLQSCTFWGNTSVIGNAAFADTGSTVNLENCIAWANDGTSQVDQVAKAAGGFLFLDYCCVQGWNGTLGGVSNFGLDPLLLVPAGRDGIAGTIDDNLRLSASSPCIDSGDASLLPLDFADLDGDGDVVEAIPLDLDANPRVIGVLDRGAYETPTRGVPRPTLLRSPALTAQAK